MIRACLLALYALALSGPAAAQTEPEPRASIRDLFKKAPDPGPRTEAEPRPRIRPVSRAEEAAGARLRMLDKLTGEVATFDLAVDETRRVKRLEMTLKSCRKTPVDEKDDAFAYLIIRDLRDDAPRFAGWMFASSPALSAVDHARYDVWVLNCTTSAAETSGDSASKSD